MVLLILAQYTASAFQSSMPLHVISRADRLHDRSRCFEHIICTSISTTMYLRHDLTGPSTKLHMVRNIDLPEAIVFYGVESMMENHSSDESSFALRPGIIRLLNECRDVGTSSLLLSEFNDDTEESLYALFQTAYRSDSDNGGEGPHVLTKSDDPVLSFRCLSSEFKIPPTSPEGEAGTSDTYEVDPVDDESLELYNLQTSGRSPSPAFLLDALRSVHIDPKGFGGSSGFGRGQWIDPRRSPMTARTVVFIAGDRVSTSKDSTLPRVKDRCGAARAAGCRVIYLENLEGDMQDDTQTMSLCDAVVDSYGNDNLRDLQPISLDAISTPGDYWLNPPSQRDEFGNSVSIDELVEWYRTERESGEASADTDHIKAEEEMSEDEMAKILADLDGI